MNWLRSLLKMFYAPGRALSEVRDHTPFAVAAILSLSVNGVYLFVVQQDILSRVLNLRGLFAFISVFFESAGMTLLIALVFVPLLIFFANIFNRSASYRLVLQQEYASTASTVLYTWAASGLVSLFLFLLARMSGLQASLGQEMLKLYLQQQKELPPSTLTQIDPRMLNPEIFAAALSLLLMWALFVGWAVVAVHDVFRFSWGRALAVVLVSVVITIPAAHLLLPIFSWLFASPFLLLLFVILLRGYMGELTRATRARASFKQNLEAATLNPADASAHYNLGLIHLQRNELDQARERFERAVHIDEEEIDAHYQLGRIARAQGRLPDAIKHFEQVVGRDAAHAQHEIWREIGATYIAAGQFEDARNALERFLEHRQSDPEGLYLMGRAHAGLGHAREAASAMQACIEAVKTAPAYKYRTEKRWLNEAQQFLRSQAM